jgi:hypothetical protein
MVLTITPCTDNSTRARETSPVSRSRTSEVFHNQPRNQYTPLRKRVPRWNAIRRRIENSVRAATADVPAKGCAASASAIISARASCQAVSFRPLPNEPMTARSHTLPAWSKAARSAEHNRWPDGLGVVSQTDGTPFTVCHWLCQCRITSTTQHWQSQCHTTAALSRSSSRDTSRLIAAFRSPRGRRRTFST